MKSVFGSGVSPPPSLVIGPLIKNFVHVCVCVCVCVIPKEIRPIPAVSGHSIFVLPRGVFRVKSSSYSMPLSILYRSAVLSLRSLAEIAWSGTLI